MIGKLNDFNLSDPRTALVTANLVVGLFLIAPTLIEPIFSTSVLIMGMGAGVLTLSLYLSQFSLSIYLVPVLMLAPVLVLILLISFRKFRTLAVSGIMALYYMAVSILATVMIIFRFPGESFEQNIPMAGFYFPGALTVSLIAASITAVIYMILYDSS